MSDINDHQPKTREELYQRIRESSKEAFIYSDMIRLGFWDKNVPMPTDPPDEVKKRTALQDELQKLKSEIKMIGDEKAMLKKIRKEKLEASKIKQKENKLKREEEKKKRAELWKEKQSTDIVYLGKDVSKGLNNHDQDLTRLNKYNLPSFKSPLELAQAMEIDLAKLRFMAFSRKVSKYSHYVRFQLVKKSGGMRTISAPRKKLKDVQHWILNNILNKVETDQSVHGFKIARSIVTNAQNHLKADAVINLDLENFFPTINYKRVKGMFVNLGYSESIATILALITTEPEINEVELDNKKWFIASGQRFVPQGAPTSPAITNIICRTLDKRISRLIGAYDFTYTRYADDITLSARGEEAVENIGKILKYTKNIIEEEGFIVNENKTKVLRKNTCHDVTGIVVNEKLNVQRKNLKKFRATLYQIENEGFAGKNWNNSKNTFMSIIGYANFINSVNPDKGKVFLEQIERIKAKYPEQLVISTYKKPVKEKIQVIETVETIVEPEAPKEVKKKWWKLF